MAIFAAFVTGILGLIGGFVGAWLGRGSEYQKWLRQERNTAFGRFLLKMKEFQTQALDLVLEIKKAKEDDRLNADIRLTELKLDFGVEENIVRLYLSESDRDTFSAAIKELLDAHNEAILQGRRMDVREKVNQKIRNLFEKVLHSNE